MRVLKHHEQKLLKKVNFLAWKNEHNQRELQVRVVLCAGECNRRCQQQREPPNTPSLLLHSL
jgi:predicted metal-binding protein